MKPSPQDPIPLHKVIHQAELDASLLPPMPPRREDSEAVEEPEPVFLWTFTCFGSSTAARIHIRVRARGMTEAERKVEALGFSIDKLVEVQELAPEHFVS